MNREKVNSSNIESIGHDKDKKVLEVEFKNGSVYQYDDVELSEYTDLLTADSVGGHFHAYIKGKSYRKV